jgi:hypothetical protein
MTRKASVRRTLQIAALTLGVAPLFAASATTATAITPSLPGTRYVAPSGSDSANGCLVSSLPCATIQHAVGQALAGDSVEVAAGTYAESQIAVDKPLVLKGAGPGQTIVDGSASTGQAKNGLLRFDSPAVGDISVSGFTFEGANGGNATEEALTMLFSGIPAGSNVSVSENELLTNEALDPDIATDWSLGIYVSNSHAAFDVEGNRFDGMWQGMLVERSTGATTIAGNEFANLATTTSGPNVWPAEGVLILSIGANSGAGEAVTSRQVISENYFHGYAGQGVAVQAGHASATPITPNVFSDVTVAGNEIDLGGAIFPVINRPLAGVMLKTGQTGSAIEGAEVFGNTIAVAAPGNDVELEGDVTGTEVHANRLGGSPAAGLDASLVTGPVSAADNWWGCNAGPGTPGCVAAAGQVESTPNLVLTGSASPAQLQPGQAATITAGLGKDSSGATVAGVPGGGSQVSFAAALGTLSPSSAPLSQGVASSVFTAGSQPGDAGLTVSLDGQQVAVPLAVLAPPAAVVTQPQPQPQPQPAPPAIETASGGPKVVPGSGRVTVATVFCAVGTCEVQAAAPSVKAGGKTYRIRVKVPAKVAAGSSAPVQVVLTRKAKEALAKSGRGQVHLKLTVTSSGGISRTVDVSLVLKVKRHQK